MKVQLAGRGGNRPSGGNSEADAALDWGTKGSAADAAASAPALHGSSLWAVTRGLAGVLVLAGVVAGVLKGVFEGGLPEMPAGVPTRGLSMGLAEVLAGAQAVVLKRVLEGGLPGVPAGERTRGLPVGLTGVLAGVLAGV